MTTKLLQLDVDSGVIGTTSKGNEDSAITEEIFLVLADAKMKLTQYAPDVRVVRLNTSLCKYELG